MINSVKHGIMIISYGKNLIGNAVMFQPHVPESSLMCILESEFTAKMIWLLSKHMCKKVYQLARMQGAFKAIQNHKTGDCLQKWRKTLFSMDTLVFIFNFIAHRY